MSVYLVGNRVIVSSFAGGTRIVEPKVRETELDALVHAQRLQQHGLHELADKYLEDYLQRNIDPIRH